jgi:hypothetical protein
MLLSSASHLIPEEIYYWNDPVREVMNTHIRQPRTVTRQSIFYSFQFRSVAGDQPISAWPVRRGKTMPGLCFSPNARK